MHYILLKPNYDVDSDQQVLKLALTVINKWSSWYWQWLTSAPAAIDGDQQVLQLALTVINKCFTGIHSDQQVLNLALTAIKLKLELKLAVMYIKPVSLGRSKT